MSGGCEICGAEKHLQAYACRRCKKILDRIETRKDAAGVKWRVDRDARRRALGDAWRDGAFHCFYTGVRLIDDSTQWRNHRYLEFEHQKPGDASSVVVTCSLVNRMKTDLSDAEFERMVRALAKMFDDGEFDEDAFPEGKRPPGT